MNTEDIAVAIYGTHQEAEESIKTLQRSSFDMRKLSIMGRDYGTEEHVLGHFNAGDRVKLFGKWDKFLLVVHGTADEIAKAKDVQGAADVTFEQHAAAV
jgi:hypothetical protein